MHDGSLATLEDVLDWYAGGGIENPNLSEYYRKIELNEDEKRDLIEFIKACTGELPEVERGRLPADS
jgi:cytochrome c peroxidase